MTRDQSLYLSTTFGETNYEQTFSEEKTKSKNKISGEKNIKNKKNHSEQMANMRYAMHATRGRTLPCINCSENTPQCWIELFSCQGMNWYNTHCKALHRVGVNLWVQTTVGGWVWLKSHLDLVGGTEKIAMAHGVIREVKDLVLAR